jgi:plasmid stabilization system protein ParE
VRRGLVRRFPYGVFYVVTDDAIVILAVFHASRDPAGWRSRT